MTALRRIAGLTPGLRSLAHYQPGWLPSDLIAGLSVAAVALPVGIAYADLAGVPAIVGIYAAIFPLLAYAVFGSSRQLIIGPDAATCLLFAASLASFTQGDAARYMALLPVLTLMTGAICIAAGIARLGFLSSFLSQPILIGYMNGVALMVLAGQLAKLFGYTSGSREFIGQISAFAAHLDSLASPTALLGLATVAGLLLLRRFARRLPGPLIAVAVGIAAALLFGLQARGVKLTGPLPAGLPQPRLPTAGLPDIVGLLEDAAMIMLVSFAGGMLTAKSFATRNNYTIDANQELIALGAGNMVSGLLGGFAVAGTDSRTAVNDAAGGKSMLAGTLAAAAMLVALLLGRDVIALVPGATLAAVVFVSAIGLLDIAGLVRLARVSRREAGLCAATTIGVLVLGVVPSVGAAVALSLLWLLIVASRPNVAVLGAMKGTRDFHSIADFPGAVSVPGLLVVQFEAELLFFNIDYFDSRLRALVAGASPPVRWVVIDASTINWTDATALDHLARLHRDLAGQGITLALAGVRRSLRRAFNTGWTIDWLRQTGIQEFRTVAAAHEAFVQQQA